MKICLISDLHLDHCEYYEDMPDADCLLIAGDIANGGLHTLYLYKQQMFFDKCRKHFDENWYNIQGNHEFYNEDWDMALDPYTVELNDDIVLIAATLWSGEDSRLAYNMLNDSLYIENFTWEKMYDRHKEHLNYIEDELKKYVGKKTIVMTHHAPHRNSIHERFWRNPATIEMNAAFFTPLDHIFESDYAPDIWVHGHVHNSFDYVVNNTRVLCNPRGYCNEFGRRENVEFDPLFVFEI
jgi:Icc-related predicted phosphoesterase